MCYIYCMETNFYKKCTLCPRNCGADRTAKAGVCGMGADLVVARAALHHYEEPVISGTRGSGAIFFAGCNMGCVYCQNREISRDGFGRKITPQRLAQIFDELIAQGAQTINLVTPTHFVPQIAEALAINRPAVPVVFNCSGYEKVDTLKLIAPYVDVYLPDFKYADPAIAQKYSKCADYPAVAIDAIRFMTEQKPVPQFNRDGIMTSGVIVRHLVLPGATDNSVKALELLTPFKGKILLSLMSQYTPLFNGDLPVKLQRKITPLEYKRVLAKAESLGLTDGFMQELSSAESEFVPNFDLTGV